MDHYDSIIIGAGHNGLVCATYLARAGRRVLVLEAADGPGGLAADREFHPGFHCSVAHTAGHFSPVVAKDLKLEAHGLKTTGELPRVGLGADGRHVSVAGTGVTGGAEGDGDAYGRYLRLMRRCADALAPFWTKTMPRIGATSFGNLLTFAQLGLKLRTMGKQDMREFMRIASLPARDLMDEHFDNELLKATLAWDGLVGSRMAPRSPNSAVLAMLYRMHGTPVELRSLVDALAAAAASHGAEIRCGSAVDNIVVESGADGLVATGVRLGGDTIKADNVISAADPKQTFLGLVGVENLDIEFTNRISRFRTNGLVAKLHLALDGAPEFEGLDNADGRLIIAPHMDAIEFAFDDAKYGQCSQDPVMEVVVPSVRNASVAPSGQHVLSANVMYVPYELKGGWTDAARDQFKERVIDTIACYAPRIREQVVNSELLTPQDLEREYRTTGGHWHHGEFSMDQLLMMRPTYGAAQYRTPIQGLFLSSAGSHPGGDMVGAAGHNAAREVLR